MSLESFNQAILRTPLLPLSSVKGLTAKKVVELFTVNKVLLEALYLSSPTLYKEFLKHFKGSLDEAYSDKQWKIIISLTKYYCRMATRCTPFGLFSGCSIVEFTDKMNLVFPEISSLKAYVRFDMHYLSALCYNISQNNILKKYYKYKLNTGIYQVGNHMRYFERYHQQEIRFHRISSIDWQESMNKLLSIAQNGVDIKDIFKILLDEGYEVDDVENYINGLIDSQFIVSEIEPSATGPEMLNQLIKKLEEIRKRIPDDLRDTHFELNRIVSNLTILDNRLKDISNSVLGGNINKYEEIIDLLPQLQTVFNERMLFQADMFIPLHANQIDKALIHKVKKGIQVISSVSNYKADQPNLKKFKQLFFERYEERQVPLLEALDQDLGIGYPANVNSAKQEVNFLLKNIVIPESQVEQGKLFLTDNDLFWIKKIQTATENNEKVIHINEEDLKTFSAEKGYKGLSTTTVNVKVLKQEAEGVYNIVINNVGFGGSAASIIGRFAHIHTSIEKHAVAITDYEQSCHPNEILAEIVHFPDARVGNIIQRPVLRQFEIPFLAQSGVNELNTIRLEDLMISVKNDKIILYSAKHRKEIVPKLTNAHNYILKALPVYHFLCDLQYEQNENALSGYEVTGALKRVFSAIPRIQYEDIIINTARWFFDTKSNAFNLTENNIQEWIIKNNLPEQVLLSEADNDLYINFSEQLSIKVFLEEISKKGHFEIKEFLFSEFQSYTINKGAESYANELIVSLYDSDKTIFKPINQYYSGNKVDRSFSLGSEWIYVKLYCGRTITDTILKEGLYSFTRSLKRKELIDSWFFVRYEDPNPHLRIRLHCIDSAKSSMLIISELNECLAAYIDSNQIWKVQFDTYQREIERYGIESIAATEKLFCLDSEFYLRFLSVMSFDKLIEYKWIWAILCIDNMLSLFKLDTNERKSFCISSANSLLTELGNSKVTRVSLDNKYRHSRSIIEKAFGKQMPFSAELDNLLLNKSQAFMPVIDQIEFTSNAFPDNLPERQGKLWSYIHMMINRIFSSEQRVNEMACYYLLGKYYTSLLAKK